LLTTNLHELLFTVEGNNGMKTLISKYCLFTAVYCVSLTAAFGHVRQRRGWAYRGTAVSSRHNRAARTRFHRVLMG